MRNIFVQIQKILAVIRSRFCQNLKRGAHLWDQLFSVHFFVTNMSNIVLHKKNTVFGKLTKSDVTVLKDLHFL